MQDYLGPRFLELSRDQNFTAKMNKIERNQRAARADQADAARSAPVTTTGEVYLGKTGGLSEYERQQQFLAGAKGYNRNLPQTITTAPPPSPTKP